MKQILLILFYSSLLLSIPGFANGRVSTTEQKIIEKIIEIRLDENGSINVGRDIVGSDDLAFYLAERLFKSYLGTGQMQDKIILSTAGNNVPDMVLQVIINEIKAGQKKALTKLCLEKYKVFFENIDVKKKEKLKKQFPVLFQTDYQ